MQYSIFFLYIFYYFLPRAWLIGIVSWYVLICILQHGSSTFMKYAALTTICLLVLYILSVLVIERRKLGLCCAMFSLGSYFIWYFLLHLLTFEWDIKPCVYQEVLTWVSCWVTKVQISLSMSWFSLFSLTWASGWMYKILKCF